jgi:hypothetical protein
MFISVAFTNDVEGLLYVICHFLDVHCQLEDPRRADLHNVYYQHASKKGPTVYYRYK